MDIANLIRLIAGFPMTCQRAASFCKHRYLSALFSRQIRKTYSHAYSNAYRDSVYPPVKGGARGAKGALKTFRVIMV